MKVPKKVRTALEKEHKKALSAKDEELTKKNDQLSTNV